MPEYTFWDEDAEREVIVFFESMEGPDGPPGIGELLEGTNLRRRPDLPVRPVVREIQFTGWSQPQWAKGARHYTKDGVPMFENKRQVEEYVAVQNSETMENGGQQGGEVIEYDAAPTNEDLQNRKRKRSS
jgi:hypothetical protein